MTEKKIIIEVSGMTCGHCEKTVAQAVTNLSGVLQASASFPKGQAEIVIDAEKADLKAIKKVIEQAGYKVKSMGPQGRKHPASKVIPIFLIIIAMYFIIRYTVGFDFFNLIPRIDQSISLAALFVTGLLTSVHCIAMCGGINLSQSLGTDSRESDTGRGVLKKNKNNNAPACIGPGEKTGKDSRFKRPLLYNLGRVISYTLIGGIVGGLGSLLFISGTVKGVIMLIAGAFMILMSLSMLGWLPHWLVPRLPAKWSAKTAKAKAGRGPFIVGLLNGLLPCGPLQAMQLYALSTGSVWMGALSMLLFSLGTVPLMLGAGVIFSFLKGKFTRAITRVSAVLVMLIAVVMLVNATGFFGWSIFSSDPPPAAQAQGPAINGTNTGANAGNQTYAKSGAYTIANIMDGYQEVTVDVQPGSYPPILVQKGIPVRFNLRAEKKNLNGCNGTILIPKYYIQKELQPGDNIIEFTPDKAENITFTCWMSMIRSSIAVVDDLRTYSGAEKTGTEATASPQATSGQSGTTSGGCCSQSTATAFAGGKIPTDNILVANVMNNEQILEVTVNDQGYTPAVLVVQKGLDTLIKFKAEKLSSCDSYVYFPDYGAGLDLSSGELETPWLKPGKDFTFECGMGMLHGYVKVVDDIKKVDLDAIKTEVENYKPQNNGSSCCGG